MARRSFDSILAQIKDEVLILGSMVERAAQEATDALLHRDVNEARAIYKRDTLINEKRFAIENAVLVQIATQAPMARDLRLLAAILEIISELERMGDYAKGNAKVALLLEDAEIPIPVNEFQKMTTLGLNMLHRGLTAFINEDISLAQRVSYEDDQVDESCNRIYRKIVATMIANPEIIDQGNYLMWAAHNLERLADRVVNICERTIFTATGEQPELEMADEEEVV